MGSCLLRLYGVPREIALLMLGGSLSGEGMERDLHDGMAAVRLSARPPAIVHIMDPGE